MHNGRLLKASFFQWLWGVAPALARSARCQIHFDIQSAYDTKIIIIKGQNMLVCEESCDLYHKRCAMDCPIGKFFY